MTFDVSTLLLQWAAGGLAVLLGHDPAPRGRARLRLAVALRLRRDGGRCPASRASGDYGTGATIRNVGAAGVAVGAFVRVGGVVP